MNNQPILTILGTIRIIVTAALSWLLVAVLTSPNKPVDNGLQMLFPGLIILVFSLPSAFASAKLILHGIHGVRGAARSDIAIITLLAVGALILHKPIILLPGLPFALSLAILVTLVRKGTC